MYTSFVRNESVLYKKIDIPKKQSDRLYKPDE